MKNLKKIKKHADKILSAKTRLARQLVSAPLCPAQDEYDYKHGYVATMLLSPKERALNEVRRLSRICGNRKLWFEVMPQGRWERQNDGYTDWTDWADLPEKGIEEELAMTREYLARKMGFTNIANKLEMPGGWMMGEAWRQKEGTTSYGQPYSPGFEGNPITPMTSPLKMHLWIMRVWRRACFILKPYGWRPSRRALETALISHHANFGRSGKIALRVAAASLPVMFGVIAHPHIIEDHKRAPYLCGLKVARKILIAARGWGSMRRRWAHDQNVIDCIGQLIHLRGLTVMQAENIVVDTMFSRAPEEDAEGYVLSAPIIKHGISEQVCFRYDYGFKDTNRPWLDRGRNWNYSGISVYSRPGTDYTPYHTESGPRAAIIAWKKQREATRKAAERNGKLAQLLDRDDGAMTVVFYQTGRDAGNCHVGLKRWGADHGYSNCVPLEVVVASSRFEAKSVINQVIATY